MTKMLILGGTSEAKQIARRISAMSIEVIYSVAGLVRQPDLDCSIVSGGFTQFGGLSSYLKNESIDVLLDALHPYARRMSGTACDATRDLDIPLIRFKRAAWKPQPDDNWICFDNWVDLVSSIKNYKSIFFTVGQLDQSFVNHLAQSVDHRQKQVIRTAIEPAIDMPPSMKWLKDIGPFDKAKESALFLRYQFDAVICKNSGGSSTFAKLKIAREKQIPVYMLERPDHFDCENRTDVNEFDDVESCLQFINQTFDEKE